MVTVTWNKMGYSGNDKKVEDVKFNMKFVFLEMTLLSPTQSLASALYLHLFVVQ